ncbi:MAG: hypothetical protein AB8H86_26830 [Polyangiales bacterium]
MHDEPTQAALARWMNARGLRLSWVALSGDTYVLTVHLIADVEEATRACASLFQSALDPVPTG